MIHKIYSVYDNKAEIFMPPWYQPTHGQSQRVFSDACREAGHPFSLNPADYHLFYLGEYNDSTGLITSNSEPAKMLEAQGVVDAHIALMAKSKKDLFNV